IYALAYLTGLLRFAAVDARLEGGFREAYGREGTIRGIVVGGPEIKDYGVRYVVEASEMALHGGEAGGRRVVGLSGCLSLTVFDGYGYGIAVGDPPDVGGLAISSLRHGDEVSFKGTVERPDGRRNPGGYDHRSQLKAKGISATCGTDALNVTLVAEGAAGPIRLAREVKAFIGEAFDRLLPERESAFLRALVIGDRSAVDEDTLGTARTAGVAYLITVSGLQVAIVFAPLERAMKKLRVKGVPRVAISVSFLLAFATVAGYAPSIVRACLMCSIMAVSKALFKDMDTQSALALASLPILIHNPCVVHDVGFQLSFTAVLSIAYVSPSAKAVFARLRMPPAAAGAVSVPLGAQLGTLPLTMAHFNGLSPYSLLASLAAVPLVGAAVILGFAVAATAAVSMAAAAALSMACVPVVSAILTVMELVSRLPYAYLIVATPPALFMAAYYPVCLTALHRLGRDDGAGWGRRLTAAAAMAAVAALAFRLPFAMRANEADVYFLDVGQGDAAVIVDGAGRFLVVDGGGRPGGYMEPGKGPGRYVVVPFLLYLGCTRPDVILVSHSDDDHIAGALEVLDMLGAGLLALPDVPDKGLYGPIVRMASDRGCEVVWLSAGQGLELGGDSSLTVLSPGPEVLRGSGPVTSNNGSMVLRFTHGAVSALFAGDVEAEAEGLLAMTYGASLGSDVLKVAHHGSGTSSTESFLSLVAPSSAIISVGRNNVHGHPSVSVIGRLEGFGVGVHRTDVGGCLHMAVRGGSYAIAATVPD
ncbi:MAG: DNA internalization-related competence protein ComEC/Rec2, partial [Oscillospiraceae bacterium]|nr:DNA internalization-related competence protein ComEC/Rec2 [Oscillospiraceae bacterium]